MPVGRASDLLPHLRGSSRATAGPDVLAGLTVAAIAIPQGMAYALIAGLPLEMGLWAAALPALVAALFGSSPYLITGPTQPIALVLGLSVVGPVLAAGEPAPIAVVLQIAALAGLLLAALGVLGLGGAARFLSDSVIAGLIVGVGVLIVIAQLRLLGVESAPPAAPAQGVPRVWPLLVAAAGALASADPRDLILALAVPLCVLALRRLDPRIPGPLLALGGAALAAAALGWLGEGGLATLPAAHAGVPRLVWPGLPRVAEVGSPALAIALLVAVQSTAAARALARSSQPALDPDRELFGQGAANLAASVLGALPTSGSFSRSSLARSAGARTRLTGVMSGAAVLALLPVLDAGLVHVPLAALAGLVILTGLDLIDPVTLRRSATTRGDAAVLVVTFAATMSLDLVQAIYAGVVLSLLLLVWRGGRLQMVELVRAGKNLLRELPLDATTGSTPVVVLHLEGDLNFAIAPELSERLRQIAARGPRVLILRLKRAGHLDATVIEALRRFAQELERDGRTLMLCGLTARLAELLEGTELARLLGPEGLLRTGPRLLEGYERALQRARDLLGPATDEELFRREDPAAWSYEI